MKPVETVGGEVATHLVDTSALIRARQLGHWEDVASPVISGRWALCPIVRIEILRGTAANIFAELSRSLALMPEVAIMPADFARALEIQEALARTSQHMGVKPPDLLIASAAERTGMTVKHHDADYDLIAGVTGISTEWFLPV